MGIITIGIIGVVSTNRVEESLSMMEIIILAGIHMGIRIRLQNQVRNILGHHKTKMQLPDTK